MPDITDQILNESESYYPPSVEDLLTYESDLLYEGKYLSLKWATNEIQEHSLNWVRVGLVAEVVKRYRLYRKQFSRWQDYCQQAIGKSTWQIKRYIKSAKVVIELIKAGFTILPNCEAQASKLVRYLDESFFGSEQKLLCDKWRQIIERVPKHCITHHKIDEELGHVSAAKKTRITVRADVAEQIKTEAARTGAKPSDVINDAWENLQNGQDELWGLPKPLRDRIEAEAKRTGESVTEVMIRVLGQHFEQPEEVEDPDETDLENVQTCTVSPQKIERWQADLEDLIQEHDRHIWLSCCMLLKLVPRELVPL